MEKQRLLSLDVFRGFTILLMTVVNNPGSWGSIYKPLDHAEWNGCTLADLVFPFFILILGVAVPLAMPVQKLDFKVFEKILVRSLRIFCLGWFLFFFGKINFGELEGFSLIAIRMSITVLVCYALLGSFSTTLKRNIVFTLFSAMMILALCTETFAEVRIPGVLQRIAIVYFATALLYLTLSFNNQIFVIASLLVGYYLLMNFVDVPGVGEANVNKGTNLSAWLDNILFGTHNYAPTKTWDPEGSLSTLPAIANGMIGAILGQIIARSQSQISIVKNLIILGAAMVGLGLVCDFFFPINKALWSSSYVLFTAGLGSLSIGILYFIIDIKKTQTWSKPFLIWGVNPMIVFFFSGIIPRVLSLIKFDNPTDLSEKTNLQSYLYKNFIAVFFESPFNASLSGSLVYIVIWTFILWIFYRKNLIFKV
ncbi:MAG: hypothetical protein RLZZ312_888 [Bacteroidota bacterium]